MLFSRSHELTPSTTRVLFRKKFFAQSTATLRNPRLPQGHVAILTTAAHLTKNMVRAF